MRIGVSLGSVRPDREPELYVPLARAAEELGFDSVWLPDHVLRTFDRHFVDPLVALGTIAGATERIRLGTSVLIVPYRNPVHLAHEAAALDVLSGGRFVLGVGAGWSEEEFRAVGVPLAERGRRTDAALETVRALWRDPGAGLPPRTPGGPPLWVGGHTDGALRRALRYGDAWHGYDVYAEDVPALRERLERVGGEAGRRLPLTFVSRIVPPGGEPADRALAGVEELRRLAELGVDTCVLAFTVPAVGLEDALRWAAAELRLG